MTEGAVCICSRGLVHSRILEPIWSNLKGRRESWELLTTDDLPIPDAQNRITDLALGIDAEWLWFVEEDVRPASDVLARMLATGKKIVTADYRLTDGSSHIHRKQKTIEFCGMGCLLVHSGVFGKVAHPWFETYRRTGEYYRLTTKSVFGGQDVDFSRKAVEAGYEIGEVPVLCVHYRLDHMGEVMSNNGVHKIVER
jgi:hypothetical protein